MRKCSVCGTNNFDTAVTCERCNSALDGFRASPIFEEDQEVPKQINSIISEPPKSKKISDACRAAKICLLISTTFVSFVAVGLFIMWVISLALSTGELGIVFKPLAIYFLLMMFLIVPIAVFTIYATVRYTSAVANGEKIGFGMKMAVLLFVNCLAGILMLCDEEH